MRIGPALAIVCVLLGGPALAGDVPLGDQAFTTYMQQKLQLYTARTLTVTAPFTLSVPVQPGVAMTMKFRTLHDQCVAAPQACDGAIHDYVQDAARSFESWDSAQRSPGAAPAADAMVPSDQDGFMRDFARRVAVLMPQTAFTPDGTALQVTRPGGERFNADFSGLYAFCRQTSFHCAGTLDRYAARFRETLSLPAQAELRVSLRYVPGCSVIASVGNSIQCRVRPSPAPLSAFFRRAFSNMGATCFKPAAGGTIPLTNADRKDMGWSVDAALDACTAATRAALGPLTLPPAGRDGVGELDAPWAASYALMTDAWSSWAAQSDGHFLIAIPSRDTLLYIKGDGADAQAALGSHVAALFGQGVGVSPDVYRWTGDGFTLGTEQSVMTMRRPTTVDTMPRVP